MASTIVGTVITMDRSDECGETVEAHFVLNSLEPLIAARVTLVGRESVNRETATMWLPQQLFHQATPEI